MERSFLFGGIHVFNAFLHPVLGVVCAFYPELGFAFSPSCLCFFMLPFLPKVVLLDMITSLRLQLVPPPLPAVELDPTHAMEDAELHGFA